MTYYLSVLTRSDASFGRGDGVPGLIDSEIDHDDCGCPELGGRRLKGLLVEERANLEYALGLRRWARWAPVSERLFGRSGATSDGYARMHVGAATLPAPLREALHAQVVAKALSREEVLAALTTIRRQTALDPRSGSPEIGSLRSARVLLRDTPLIARLEFSVEPADEDLALLAACALAVRRGGGGRNRGRGRIDLLLHREPPENLAAPHAATFTQECFQEFARLLREVA